MSTEQVPGRYGESSDRFAWCSAALGATDADHGTNVFTHKVADKNHGHPPASAGPVTRNFQKNTLRASAR